MNNIYREIARRIRLELPNIERLANRILLVWNRAKLNAAEQDVYIESAALNLQSFYSGIEHLFEYIARDIDRSMPTGENWHISLLSQMGQEFGEIRPAVISEQDSLRLLDYLKFRHVVRNIYTHNLNPDRMNDKISNLPELLESIKAEFMSFADFLDFVATTE